MMLISKRLARRCSSVTHTCESRSKQSACCRFTTSWRKNTFCVVNTHNFDIDPGEGRKVLDGASPP